MLFDGVGAYPLISRSASEDGDTLLPSVRVLCDRPSPYLQGRELGRAHEILLGNAGSRVAHSCPCSSAFMELWPLCLPDCMTMNGCLCSWTMCARCVLRRELESFTASLRLNCGRTHGTALIKGRHRRGNASSHCAPLPFEMRRVPPVALDQRGYLSSHKVFVIALHKNDQMRKKWGTV